MFKHNQLVFAILYARVVLDAISAIQAEEENVYDPSGKDYN